MSRTGLVERYTDQVGNGAQRFWVHERILCGGSIISQDDYEHLKRDFGVTGVMNFCNDRPDNATIEYGVEMPFSDNGNSISKKFIHDALDWAREFYLCKVGVLYVHCALGGSRGPSMAYAICRGVLGMSRADTLRAIQAGHPLFIGYLKTFHPKQYVHDIEEALLTWPRR
jgi:hypothetical protein